MKTTVKALQDLYVKLGGQLTDTYANIADGIKVGLYKRIPDVIEAVKEKASGGGGGAGLPEVTAADNGDVLTVVEGAWAKADPPSGGTFDIEFIVTYDETTDEPTYSCNKTVTEILTEHQANGYDNIRVTLRDSDSNSQSLPASLYIDGGSITANFLSPPIPLNELYALQIVAHIDQSTQEDVVTYEEKFYTLTPSE